MQQQGQYFSALLMHDMSNATADPLANPDFFPIKFDLPGNAVIFVQMSRESLHASPFLDHRAVRAGPTRLAAALPRLVQRRPGRPLHFILHSAFCGSTLLARYLQEAPHCLVLKEPMVLGQLSLLDERAFQQTSWSNCFAATFALLARAYPGDTAVVVKAPDACNWMGQQLLDHDERTKLVFLYSSLKVFLLQVLKAEHRREWLRGHIKALCRPLNGIPFLAGLEPSELSDCQRAAAIWLLNAFLCGQLIARRDSHRVMAVSGEQLISDPKQTVMAVADFLELISDETNREALRHLQPLRAHAKDGKLPYDANARGAELKDAEARLSGEIAMAMDWAANTAAVWLAQSPLPVQ